jgi:hypothetical protein
LAQVDQTTQNKFEINIGLSSHLPKDIQIEKMDEKKHFDITPSMVPYFDVHLLIPLFDFLKEVSIICSFYSWIAGSNHFFLPLLDPAL